MVVWCSDSKNQQILYIYTHYIFLFIKFNLMLIEEMYYKIELHLIS